MGESLEAFLFCCARICGSFWLPEGTTAFLVFTRSEPPGCLQCLDCCSAIGHPFLAILPMVGCDSQVGKLCSNSTKIIHLRAIELGPFTYLLYLQILQKKQQKFPVLPYPERKLNYVALLYNLAFLGSGEYTIIQHKGLGWTFLLLWKHKTIKKQRWKTVPYVRGKRGTTGGWHSKAQYVLHEKAKIIARVESRVNRLCQCLEL